MSRWRTRSIRHWDDGHRDNLFAGGVERHADMMPEGKWYQPGAPLCAGRRSKGGGAEPRPPCRAKRETKEANMRKEIIVCDLCENPGDIHNHLGVDVCADCIKELVQKSYADKSSEASINSPCEKNKRKPQYTRVKQIGEDGKTIRIFPTLKAAEDQLKLRSGSLSVVLNNGDGKLGGFMWERVL